MGFFDRERDEVIERLLSDPQSALSGASAETAAFVRALPAAVAAPPNPALGAELVPALARTARAAGIEASHQVTSSLETVPAAAPRWVLRLAVLGAAIALLPVLMAGLAYAGVELPDPVDEAFDAAGIDLPNQSDAGDPPAGSEGGGDGKDDATGGKDPSSSKDAAGTADTNQAPAAGGGDGSGDDSEGGNGNGDGKPEHAGPEAAPPGHGGTPPGQGGVPPGNAGVPPGGGSGGSTGPPPDAGPPPGAGAPAAPPGQGGTPPGQGGVPPGQADPK